MGSVHISRDEEVRNGRSAVAALMARWKDLHDQANKMRSAIETIADVYGLSDVKAMLNGQQAIPARIVPYEPRPQRQEVVRAPADAEAASSEIARLISAGTHKSSHLRTAVFAKFEISGAEYERVLKEMVATGQVRCVGERAGRRYLPPASEQERESDRPLDQPSSALLQNRSGW